MVTNLLLTPVNVATVIPFVRLGCWIVGAPPISISVALLMNQLRTDSVATLTLYGTQLLYGILAWVMLAPVLVGGGFVLLRPCAWLLIRATKGHPDTE